MTEPEADPVPLPAALRVWTLVALQSFGGPAGQIAVMHRILVEEKRWISEQRFLHALNYCMLLPGPEAQQLAIYIGWLLNRTPGGLAAGILFVLPGFFCFKLIQVPKKALFHQYSCRELNNWLRFVRSSIPFQARSVLPPSVPGPAEVSTQ